MRTQLDSQSEDSDGDGRSRSDREHRRRRRRAPRKDEEGASAKELFKKFDKMRKEIAKSPEVRKISDQLDAMKWQGERAEQIAMEARSMAEAMEQKHAALCERMDRDMNDLRRATHTSKRGISDASSDTASNAGSSTSTKRFPEEILAGTSFKSRSGVVVGGFQEWSAREDIEKWLDEELRLHISVTPAEGNLSVPRRLSSIAFFKLADGDAAWKAIKFYNDKSRERLKYTDPDTSQEVQIWLTIEKTKDERLRSRRIFKLAKVIARDLYARYPEVREKLNKNVADDAAILAKLTIDFPAGEVCYKRMLIASYRDDKVTFGTRSSELGFLTENCEALSNEVTSAQ